MADKDLQMDVAPEEKKSSKGMLIIIVVLLLVIIGGGAFFFLSGGDDAPTPTAPVEEQFKDAIYAPIRPAFVVNFANATPGKTRFLQLEVTLMGRNPELMAKLEDNMPLIKSKLVDVFQSQDFEDLRSAEGKDALRAMALEELQLMFQEELGDETIEKIYFTVFVLQ